jgi:cytochrome c5
MQRLSAFGLRSHAALVALACAVASACGEASRPTGTPPDTHELDAYLHDAASRRNTLTAALVNPENGYSTLRRSHYSTGLDGDWDRLPEWNPVVEPVTSADLAASLPALDPLSAAATALALPDDPLAAGENEILALGQAAFERYPVQIAPYLEVALGSADAAQRYGLWLDDARGVGGVVRAQMADGTTALALTCASCHAAPSSSGIENGLSNSSLDLGAALSDGADAIAAWGPGRLDVTTTAGTEPVRIPDLRPMRYLTYLQADATLRNNDLTTLAIRIETLAITSNSQVLRPPRIVAWAIAAYLETLSASLPDEGAAASASARGAQIFGAECSSCHQSPALTGPPVALATIGTDPTVGLSADRGTGTYRVPSLHGVGTRGPLLHDATVASLDALFDPTRPTAAFSGRLHGSGPVAGHLFGLELEPDDRSALLAYLQAL